MDLVYGLVASYILPVLVHLRDCLPISSAVQSTKVLREPMQTTEKIIEGETFSHTSHGQSGTTCLYALPLAVPVTLQNWFLWACTLCAPPLSTFLDPPC